LFADEKREGTTKMLHYLGLLFDTENMLIKRSENKVPELKLKIVLYLLIADKNSKLKIDSRI
jgi:hypothetical protein